jgi:glycosyltransferase involved in cell wall biosynthesis
MEVSSASVRQARTDRYSFMKVCIINNLYPPHARGGAEQVVQRTVDGLLLAGHEVVLVATSKLESSKVQKFKSFTFRPWNIFYYTDAHKHSFFSRIVWHLVDMFNVGSARFVRKVLEEEKPDVVHTHNLMGVGFLIPRVIRKLGIRHVHTVHDVQLVEPSGIILKTKEKSWRYSGLPTIMYIWVMKKLMGSPDVVISPSQFLKGFYSERGFFEKSKFVVVRNPLTVGSRGMRHVTRDTLQPLRFLYLGQVEEHKGVSLLVKAFRVFFEKNKNVQLHIVGDGAAISDVEKIAEGCEGIILHGRVGRDKLPELFGNTDVTVVPSLCYENSPTVIFESLSFCVPVLASNIEGIAELIQEGMNGWTFEAGDAKDLQQKMLWCTQHSDELHNMRNTIPETIQVGGDYIEEIEGLYG